MGEGHPPVTQEGVGPADGLQAINPDQEVSRDQLSISPHIDDNDQVPSVPEATF
ncbi:hypothetical protein GGH92_000912 [Coemansia sp. RSA 2673]|nr:hypothetical protein GGH92_000912 [Coemansia sp. RSA 2673]